MICELHRRRIPDGQQCSDCFREEHLAKRKADKEAGKTFGRFRKFEASKETKNRAYLKTKLQALVSRYVKKIYQDRDVYFDWITMRPNNQSGLFGLHAAHYYPKGELWQLWTDPVNIGLTGHNHNVNKPETATMMRGMMVKVWGAEAVDDLDRRAEEAKMRIATGMDRKHPDDMWLMANIKELQKKLK